MRKVCCKLINSQLIIYDSVDNKGARSGAVHRWGAVESHSFVGVVRALDSVMMERIR